VTEGSVTTVQGGVVGVMAELLTPHPVQMRAADSNAMAEKPRSARQQRTTKPSRLKYYVRWYSYCTEQWATGERS